MSTADASLILRARAAAKVILPLAARIEQGRRLPEEAVRALVDAGVFKVIVPRAFGGDEANFATLIGVIEEVARADGSAGWCAMIGATSGVMSAFLEPDVAREVYGAPDAITCGVFAPMGRATPVDGGFRVSGRWPFASGCEHSAWRMGGAVVDGGAPRNMLFRADDTRVIDTWDTSGLRGSGSHDMEAVDVFVPHARTFSPITDAPKHAGRFYALPFFGVLAASVAAVTLGIARAALDTFVDLAKSKQSLGAKRSIAHREFVQLDVAKGEAKLRAARALLVDTACAIDEEAARGEVSLPSRALLRAAASYAATESAAVVDLAYGACGATSIYAASPLQRHFRDVHVATQHVMVSPVSTTLAGRVLLGVDSDTTML